MARRPSGREGRFRSGTNLSCGTTAAPNFGVILLADNEDVVGYDLRFRSSDDGNPDQPVLQIIWTQSVKTVYFLKDHLGSIRATVDDIGQVVGYDDYDPWGYILAGRSMATGASTVQGAAKNKFTGKEYDDEFGLNWFYFIGRPYDGEIGRWVSVDPLRNSLKPKELLRLRDFFASPYAYTVNNPIIFIDPDGKKLKYAKGSRQSFKQGFGKTIQYLNKNGISGVVAQLEKRPETITIKEGTTLQDFYYDPNTKTIVYNPRSALKASTGGKQTPALGFLHEAGHALQDVQNPQQFRQDSKTKDAQYDNKEEKRVITQVENPAAKKAGEDTRADHKGTPYKVKDPTKK